MNGPITAEIIGFSKIKSRAEREKGEITGETRDERLKNLATEVLCGATCAAEAFVLLLQWSLSDKAFQCEAFDLEEIVRHSGNEILRLLG